ncbi:CAP domain-containing protein [Flavobacterium caeni]|uniref:Cysteine-rich secretory protein family protein n=1 Tax=Flavobacterium caeni TaxID=490189 RepID=A0A1G5CT84_9FLAO|nr:CAP domain-containing protein [Flavobacterium caeni]SCY05675.1 Cysteine-rich secretory protein family protein [Flavobacterium caeni]
MKTNLLRAIMPLVLVLTLVSCSSDATEDLVMPADAATAKYDYNNDELALFDAINQYRESIGLSTLQPVEYVSYKSGQHNDYMISVNEISHDFFQERSQNIMAVVGASKVNENVAYNYSTANSVLNAWLNSPGHKANIEGDFTHFGASIRINPETGKKYYTNIFIKK